jgi:simple sugar transport system ATP-binding protein
MTAVRPVLTAERVTKRYGAVTSLDGASFAAAAGEVTCLLGDNGAGKSTLIKILSGVFPPTSGRVLLGGEEVRFSSPRAASAKGIATVYQDLAVIPLMSAWRNFFLGAEPVRGRGPFRRIDARRCERVARERLEVVEVEDALHVQPTLPERAAGCPRR